MTLLVKPMRQKLSFKANCRMRGSNVVVRRPKVVLLMSLLSLLTEKFVWLKALNASARNSRFHDSLIFVRLIRLRSTIQKPGPLTGVNCNVPYWPASGFCSNCGLPRPSEPINEGSTKSGRPDAGSKNNPVRSCNSPRLSEVMTVCLAERVLDWRLTVPRFEVNEIGRPVRASNMLLICHPPSRREARPLCVHDFPRGLPGPKGSS